MGFRRSKEEADQAREWQEFRAKQQELFTKTGLPGFMDDRARFDGFLMDAFVEMPGGLADGVAFDLDELDQEQRAALGEIVRRYVDRFGDPGVDTKIRLLALRPQVPVELQAQLTDAVRAWIDAATSEAKDEAFPELCSALAWFVGSLLAEEDVWPSYWWVDSFDTDPAYDSVSVISPLALELQGVLIWGDERTQWIDPLHGSVELSDGRDRISSYDFRFGDRSTGIGHVEYDERRPKAWQRTRNWVYEFRGG